MAPPTEVAEAPNDVEAMRRQQPASLTRNDLIAQTFAALDSEFTAPSGELTARKVRTVSIGPDGMPVLEGAQTPAAETPAVVPAVAQKPAAEDAPARLQVAEAEAAPAPVRAAKAKAAPSSKPVVSEEAADEDASATAYAPVRDGAAVIGRKGANVRSAPKTRGSSVLFALAAGEEVTVMQQSKGWSKVVDKSGRSGWVWNELIRR